MKNSEHHQKDIRTNSSGATYDIDKELSGSENKGTYFDSENGRVSSDRGNKGSWEKIRGEELIHSTQQSGDWFNMCSIPVNNDKFEIWVKKNGTDDPYIAVNGQIMGQSSDMPWLYEHRIQFDENESCIGGEVMLTDFNVSPMIFSIKDIKDAFTNGDLTYFDDFNPDLYYINLTTPLDIPIFTGLVNVGGGGGLPVSSNQYSLRYVNEDGDFTNWGPLTPAIPVVQSLSAASSQFPNIKTYGSPADLANVTSYGINLKFRVTNINNYDFIEIRRISYNTESGPDFVPQGFIVAKIDIQPGEVSVQEFLDPRDSNVEIILADNEEAGELGGIELANFETPSKIADVNFLNYNGKLIFPVVEALGKAGFSDPVTHTYKKNYPSNEKFSFAINLYDGFGGSAFTVENAGLNNVQAPSRRDVMSQDSIDLSTGSVTAAAVNSLVTKTFEVFDHENAISKNDRCSFKNIMKKGRKWYSTVNELCPGVNGSWVEAEEIGYNPYRPTDKNDSVEGHNYIVNHKVRTSGDTFNYEPKGFGCDYYSRGFAIGGIENLPSWAKSFSVVRSDRAGRVVCQGIGMYSLNKGDFASFYNNAAATKETNKLWFTSPDIESGLIDQGILDDMSANPQNYSVQFSSPLGFFSEVFSFEKNLETSNRDRLVDMVAYARVLRDDGQINPGESASMGVNGYVAYNRYRNNNNAGQGAFNVPEGGNKEFSLGGFEFVSDGRSSYFELETVGNIYNISNTGGAGNNDFDDQGMKDFTEPFYIVNIIRNGAEVPDSNINSYYSTGHYQKIESIIGLGEGTSGQSFVLVDERWEDCIPSLTATGFNNTGESFLDLTDSQQSVRKCFNVTYKTPAEISVIINDISLNGFHTTPGGVNVQGIYTHSVDADGNITIEFDNSITIPSEDERIIIRYDKTRPIRFFGGDTVVGENTFCPIDKETDGSQSGADEQFDFNIGFPFRKFDINPRHYIVKKANATIDRIQNDNTLSLGFIRQMIIMYACESRISSALSFNGQFPSEFYPLTNYIMRPNRWSDSSFDSGVIDDIVDDNNMQPDYFEDYPEEYNFWKFGGFRFDQQFNTDYSVKGPKLYFSKPKVGFTEENKFCTGVAWSLPRSINQQNSPGLKNFPASNRYFVSDDNGEIKFLYDARTGGKGDNLYVVTESGTCLLLTKKAILSNISADDLTTTSVDTFISNEYWISRSIGSDGEMWRGKAEGSVEFNTDGGREERESLFFPNRHSVYRLTENQLAEVLKDKYYTRMHPSLQGVSNDYDVHIAGHYDKNHNEYWLQLPDVNTLNSPARDFVFDQNESRWVGRFHYSFDQYMYQDSQTYGFRDNEMYILDRGFIINGAPIECELIGHTSVAITEEKEAITIEVNTGLRGTMKPTEVEFLDEDLTILSRTNEALFGPAYLRQYSGWHCQVPRKEIAVSPERDRIQYRVLLFNIKHSIEEDFKVVSTVVQWKPLK
jgi:hypothetical protein